MTGVIFDEISNFPPFFLKGSILRVCLTHLSPETININQKSGFSCIYLSVFYKMQKTEMSISFKVQQFIAPVLIQNWNIKMSKSLKLLAVWITILNWHIKY